MKILVTGGHGQVGWELNRLSSDETHVVACSHQVLDITDPQHIEVAFQKIKPDAVVNAAAYTAVDKAEQDHALAFKVNCDGARHLAIACHAANIPLLHLSTDYVFDGMKKTPYSEGDQASPVNTYGLSKWQGELAVREHCEQQMILRVSSVFSVHGQNFVKTMLRLAKDRETLRVVNDQRVCPTSAKEIAKAILVMVKNFKAGELFHYCSLTPCSWYDFACEIIQSARQFESLATKEIIPIASSEYVTPAKRPAYSVLECQKFDHVFGLPRHTWHKNLLEVVEGHYEFVST